MRRPWFCCFAFAFALAGCPEQRGAAPNAQPEPPCEQLGQRCRTPEGPLGVCNESPGSCESPPCLACIPQH